MMTLIEVTLLRILQFIKIKEKVAFFTSIAKAIKLGL